MKAFPSLVDLEDWAFWQSVAGSFFAFHQIEKPSCLGGDNLTPGTRAVERAAIVYIFQDETAKRAYEYISHEWPCFIENHELPQLDTIHFGYQLILDLLDGLIQQYLTRISILLSLLWGRTQGIKYKRPKHVICAAMPWTILPCLVILWGVCWMFYDASQASSPVSGFEDRSDQPARTAEFKFDWQYNDNQGFDLDFWDQNVGLFSNSVDQLEPTTSEAPIGIFSGSEVQIEAEPGQPIPGLQQQQAGMPSSHSNQPIAPNDLPAAQEQAPSSEHARNPTRCTEPGCHSEFGTEREFRRHRETVHNHSEFPCAVTGCKRGDQNPFNRLDNLQRHMRKTHGQGEQAPVTAPHNMTIRGQKRRAETPPQPISSPESRRRKTEDAPDGMALGLDPLPSSGHSQDEVAKLQEQLAGARRREDIHVARIKALEKEVEAHEEKLEALKRDNEVQDAYIRLLGRKG